MAVVQMRASPIVLYHNSTHHWPLYKQTSIAPQGPSFENNSQTFIYQQGFLCLGEYRRIPKRTPLKLNAISTRHAQEKWLTLTWGIPPTLTCLRKQPTFRDTTTVFCTKRRLRKEQSRCF